MAELKAVIFDCDGVLAETERDGHRVAFNQVFKEENIDAEWSVDEYCALVRVAGGKERMKHYFNEHSEKVGDKCFDDEYIMKLHKRKTAIFAEMGENGVMPSRLGIQRIIDEAHAQGLKLFVCSTSNKKSVSALVKALFGEERFRWFSEIYAGDVVKAKKPAPDIYNLVTENHGVKGEECAVVEDNRNGLLAAKSAGMNCIVTVSYYSYGEDFKEADMVVSTLGDPEHEPIEILKTSEKLDGEKPDYITVQHMRKLAE